MDALEGLMTRRSVRAYTDEPVSDDQVLKILAAGMQAPSAGNQQPWHFVVLRRKEHLDGLAGALPFGKMLGQAPLGIVVCADVGREQHAGYWVQDCAAATQNILLACHALGLGAVWIGVYPRDERVITLRGPEPARGSDSALRDRDRPAGGAPRSDRSLPPGSDPRRAVVTGPW